MDLYGPSYGLPPAISGVDSYWYRAAEMENGASIQVAPAHEPPRMLTPMVTRGATLRTYGDLISTYAGFEVQEQWILGSEKGSSLP